MFVKDFSREMILGKSNGFYFSWQSLGWLWGIQIDTAPLKSAGVAWSSVKQGRVGMWVPDSWALMATETVGIDGITQPNSINREDMRFSSHLELVRGEKPGKESGKERATPPCQGRGGQQIGENILLCLNLLESQIRWAVKIDYWIENWPLK